MNKKTLAAVLVVAILAVSLVGSVIYFALLSKMSIGEDALQGMQDSLFDEVSYPVSYISEQEALDPILVEATQDWSEYIFKGIKFKYPHEELLPEEPEGPMVQFKNLVDNDFTYGMTLYVYDAKEYPTSMNFLENFIVTERGVITHDINQVVNIGNYEVAQVGYYIYIHEGNYGLSYGLKLGDKGVVIEYAFEVEKKYEDLEEFNKDQGHHLVNLVIQTLEEHKSLLENEQVFYLDSPDKDFLEMYRESNPNTTL